MSPDRRFIGRLEAYQLIGCQHASAASRAVPGVKVACRHRRTGEVHEAQGDELVHYMIMDRVGHHQDLEEGFTVPR